jgi:hypothetical protein
LHTEKELDQTVETLVSSLDAMKADGSLI